MLVIILDGRDLVIGNYVISTFDLVNWIIYVQISEYL